MDETIKNELFETKENELIEKYREQINYIWEEYGYDEYISFLILQRSLVNRNEGIDSDLDHVHLLIDCTPQHYITDIIKALKGVSARLLMKEFPELKKKLWGGHVWNPSYFIATVSENTEEQIRKYIQKQKER